MNSCSAKNEHEAGEAAAGEQKYASHSPLIQVMHASFVLSFNVHLDLNIKLRLDRNVLPGDPLEVENRGRSRYSFALLLRIKLLLRCCCKKNDEIELVSNIF